MVGFGFAEILVLAVMSGGMTSADLVAMVPTSQYFQARQIEVSIDKMAELASRDPKDAKTQIQQLLALRHLADESDSLKKAPTYAAHRQLLEQIAAGKRAQDSLGFAQDYARRVLAKLDNAKPTSEKVPPLRADALSWFPADVRFAAALDMRHGPGFAGEPLKEIMKLMPEETKKEMYDHVEKMGNIRIERLAFGFADAEKDGKPKIFVRFSGKVNQAWLVKTLTSIDGPQFDVKQSKDAQGVPITLLQEKNRSSPVIMFIGDTDVVITGFKGTDGKNDDLVAEVLDVRAKKKPSAAAGALKDRLAKVPDKAIALLVGEVPADFKREFRFVFDPAPANVTAFIERMPMGLDLQVETMMANGDDADKLVQKVGGLRKEGIEGLKKAMQQELPPGFPPIPFQAMLNVLESLQVQSQTDKVQVRVSVPDQLIQQLGTMSATFAGVGRAAPPLKK